MKFLITAILALFILQAEARLGETKEQTEKRYGWSMQELESPAKNLQVHCFEKLGYKIIVTFMDGISANETFTKVGDGSFSDAELEKLLESNTGDSTWEKVDQTKVIGKVWKRKDGKAWAVYQSIKTLFSVRTNEFDEYQTKLIKEEQMRKMKDF